jgi:hypothetical protein
MQPGACIIKLIMAIIYSFHNKLERLSQNTRLGWKGLPGTNTLASYENYEIADKNSFITLGPGDTL